MRALKNIDVAAAVKAFKPKIVYPYHYQNSDLKAFETALNGSGIEVRLCDWYSR